jgi:hypothetical protein
VSAPAPALSHGGADRRARHVVIPGSGVYIALTGLTPWKVPLVVGMLGLPVVARGGEPKDGGE